MYFLDNGGMVIDNPGMREVGVTDASEGLDNLFDEIIMLSEKCKYNDCTHTHEAGCEVLSAVESGKIDKDKYLNYLNLKKEAEYYKMPEVEKKKKNRNFGKFIKKAKKELKDYGIRGY
jgi:ribosome biogenesis GTPase